MLESVVVKQLTTQQEYEQVFALEQEIWQSEYEPMHELLKQDATNVLLIGAYLHDQLIGFNYSEKKDSALLYSHLLGIKREYREKGVGELIKLLQKEIAEDEGFMKCLWTFEPLAAYTAHLYFTKLRTYSTTYLQDVAPEIGKAIVLPADRLEVELDVGDHDHLRWDAKIEELREDAQDIVQSVLNDKGLPMLQAFTPQELYVKDAYTLPIPTNFVKVTLENNELAADWRAKTRAVFTTLFQQGYVVLQLNPINEHICRYLFVKRSLFAL